MVESLQGLFRQFNWHLFHTPSAWRGHVQPRRSIMTTLSGKTALVTGASRGIGRASALALAKAGAQVLVHCGRGKAEAEAVVQEIRDNGGRARAVPADLAAPDGAEKLAKEVRAI